MADSSKKVVVDIDIKAEDIDAAKKAMETAKTTAAEYQKEVNKLKLDQKELNALHKVGAVNADQYAKKQTELKKQTTEANKGVREANKEYTNNKIVVEAAKGSNDQLRASLSLMTKEYNALSKEQRENTKAGKALGAKIKATTDKLKENEKAVGDNRRNVGNYDEAIMSAAGSLNIMGVNVGGVVNTLKKQKEGLAAMAAAQKASNVATGAGTKALRIFKIALAATGIGLVVVALGALVTFLTQTKRGVELTNRVMAGFKATLSVVTDRLSILGEAITTLFSGDVSGAAETAAGAFKDIGEEIVNETKAAVALEKQMQKLVDSERALKIEQAGRKAEVAELQLLAEDETKTFAERGEAIKKATEIQTDLMQKQLALQRERVRITEEQLELGENLEEDENRLAEERVKLGEIEAANLKKMRTLKAKENSIVKQEHAQLVKRENEKRKLTEEEAKAEAKAAEDSKKIRDQFKHEQMTELEQRKAEALSKADELKAAGVAEVEVERFLSQELLEIHRAEQDAILDEKLKGYEDQAEAARVKIRSEVEDEGARAIALLAIDEELLLAKQQLLDMEANAYQASIDDLGVVDEERQTQLLTDKAEVDAQIVELDRQKTDQLKAHADEVAEKNKETAKDEIEARNATISTTIDVLDSIRAVIESNIKATEEQLRAAGKTEEEIAEQTKKARETAKGFAIASAIIQTFQAAIAAYSAGSAVPIVGVALGPIAAAAAVAFGLAQVANIKNQKFAEGGILQGPSHAQGGIPITVDGAGGYEAEGNEIVLTKGVYQNPQLRQIASNLNEAGGGKNLFTGNSNFMAAGGILGGSSTFAARSATNNGGLSKRDLSEAMTEALAEQPAPIVKVTDINRVNNQQRVVKVNSDLN